MYQTYMGDTCLIHLSSSNEEESESESESEEKLDEKDIEELNHTCELYVLEYTGNNMIEIYKYNL